MEVVQGAVGLERKSEKEAELRRMSVSRDTRRQVPEERGRELS